ncbi:hypothetical protein [Dongia sedimenti]|uniref:DUF883 family protein n=1 Tax=Dongia sedimenti TaxID=3064282 RepID=A0ABU0YN95_9PROT|nr:hypothetical protein [Rhodospirillaceae bacterium R-7]
MNTTSKTFGNGVEAARDTVNEAGERLEEATRGARKAAAEKLQGAAAYGRQHAGEALDAAQGLARSAGRYAKENPGQAILIGLGGLLLASLLFRRR